MSETSKVALGKEVSSLDISPQFDAYSGVEIIVTDEISYFAGNRTGRVLSIQNPWGTQAQATAILNALTSKGFQYQPYTAEGAILNPAAEIGDGVTISDTYSGLYKIDRKFSPLMAADVEAPHEEELDHEYPYEPKQDRIYKREIAEANAQISLNADAITAEVTNRTNADNNLNTTLTSKINQTATEINASVTSVTNNKLDHTRTNTTFGWSLTSSAFKINASSNKNVFTATKDGITIQGNATVTGKIQATSGYIGSSETNGIKITNYGISKGTLNAKGDDLAQEDGKYVNGVFISGTKIRMGNNFSVSNTGNVVARSLHLYGGEITINDANGNQAFRVTTTGSVTATNLKLNGGSISLKKSDGTNAFSVTSAGKVSAVDMNLSGTLTIGGSTITADKLRQGAADGYNWGSGGGGYGGYASKAAYALGGAGGGISFNKATNSGSGSYPSFFKATSLYCSNLYASTNVFINKETGNIGLGSHSHIISVDGGKVTIGSPKNGEGSFNIADTQYYKDGVSAAYSNGSAAGASGVSVSSVSISYVIGNTAYINISLTNGRESTYARVLP